MHCEKCQRPLQDCQKCKGGRQRGVGGAKLTCANCRSTGQVCPTHKGAWKRGT
jgi:hypothetical protein